MADAHSVKQHLDVDPEAYDVQIRRFIPNYDDMLAMGVELVSTLARPTARVLDLGGGTGALSAAVLRGMPRAQVTVLDVDPDMLAVARRRLAEFGDRVDFRAGSFSDSLPPSGAVVASLALHHIHNLEQKVEVYRRIRAALEPGGVFVNIDAAVSEGERLQALGIDHWIAHMGANGISEDEARSNIATWAEEDRYFPLDVELGALRQAGFAEVECVFRSGLGSICCALS